MNIALKTKFFKISFLIFLCFLLDSTNSHAFDSTEKISLLQFNVENLFDTIHDEGKNDFTYLPLELKRNPRFLDLKDGSLFQKGCVTARYPKWRMECLNFNWSEVILEQKLESLANVIRQVNDGRGADLVFLQEVENIRVLKRLALKTGIRDYHPILIEGEDERGIDVALLSKFPIKSSKLHRFTKSRGILQVSIDGPHSTPIEVFVLHLPAPYHSSLGRKAQLKRLNQLAKPLKKRAVVIAAGDFNISSKEEKEEGLIKKYSQELGWKVASKQGCKKCLGTHYYARAKEWSFLDQIWVLEAIEFPWFLVPESIVVANQDPGQKQAKAPFGPRRMEIRGERLLGVSDHWPLYAEMQLRK
ncbi:hypothetical protein GW916_00870 [bacterium]|nr:hypothetical protein [bacterium]